MAMRWASLAPAPQRYSYALVLGAAVLGLLAPAWAGWVLGPVLLLGLVLLGVAHGACDQFVVPATYPALARRRGRYWVVFVGSYLGLAAAMGLLWWRWPGLALGFFFGLSAWHWGSGDAPATARYRAQWLAHSALRGLLLFAVPLLVWPAATQALINALLALSGAAPVRAAALAHAGQLLGLAALVGHAALWGSYYLLGQRQLAATDLLEALLLALLLAALPPVLAGSVYFVGWHSLQHILRMNRLAGRSSPSWSGLSRELTFFWRRAAPLLAVSVAALAVLYSLPWVRAAGSPVLISLALLVASVVTLPHALLVTLGLDAARWQRAAPRAKTSQALNRPSNGSFAISLAAGRNSRASVGVRLPSDVR